MQVSVAYAEPAKRLWLRIEVPEDSTVEQAILASGILSQFPDLDLRQRKVGIFGRLVTLEAPLAAGDRVEIYRSTFADPKTVPRRQGPTEDEGA